MGHLKDGRENLRGRRMQAYVDGKWRKVQVVTHIRGDRWMVEGRSLPKSCERHWMLMRRSVVKEKDLRAIVSAHPPAKEG